MMTGYDCVIITDGLKQLTEAERDSLWDQGVNLDDWNIMLIFDDLDLTHYTDEDGDAHRPNDYWIESLLNNNCSQNWHPNIMFRDKKRTIGIGYH